MESTRTLPNEQKMRVARGWDGSGLTMSDYAGRHGISERTLRTWRSIYAPAVSVRGARMTVEKAIGQLQAVLDGLPPEPAPGRLPRAPRAGPGTNTWRPREGTGPTGSMRHRTSSDPAGGDSSPTTGTGQGHFRLEHFVGPGTRKSLNGISARNGITDSARRELAFLTKLAASSEEYLWVRQRATEEPKALHQS